MSELSRIVRNEWWVFALVAIAVIALLMWNGTNFFDAVNGIVVGIFWSVVILGSFALLVRALTRKQR